MKLLELHPEAAIVSGMLIDSRDRILRGIEHRDASGLLVTPRFGYPAAEAVWLKLRAVASVPTDLFFARTAFPREALANLPGDTPLMGLGVPLGDAARR